MATGILIMRNTGCVLRFRGRLVWAAVVSALLSVQGAGSALAQGEARLHVLAIGDTNDENIGESVQADIATFPGLFEANAPADRLSLVPPLTGGRVRKNEILRSVRQLATRVRPGVDTVVFYYSGHGAYDQVSRNDHFCALPAGERLYHGEIRAALAQLNPRLAVILTDVCSTYVRSPVPSGVAPPRQDFSPLFTSLFLKPSGVVDITAARPGEAAQARSYGGVFTFELCNVWRERSEQSMTWDEVLGELNTRAHRTNPRQTAYPVIPLPVVAGGGNVAGGRFGALAGRTALGAEDNGVGVLWVAPNSPATRIRDLKGQVYTLVAGRDVITHINGEPVRSAREYAAAVRGSVDLMEIRVVDHQAGTVDRYMVQLADGQTRFGVNAQATPRGQALGGVEVTSVIVGSPGSRIRLNGTGQVLVLVPYRDVITHVNGDSVIDEKSFREAVRRSPDTIRLRVHDSQTGTTLEYEAELVP